MEQPTLPPPNESRQRILNLRRETLPPDYARVRTVRSFEELVSARFEDGINALCWARTLTGNFEEIVARVDGREDIDSLDETTLESLPLSAEGRAAARVVSEDLRRLRERGLDPVLDCIRRYPRDESDPILSTDVYSFHADSAPVEADTFLCSYTEAASEGLRNEEALRRVDLPETRAKLLRKFGGTEGEAFREYLHERCYDLHYAPIENAQPFSFGLGNLWRIAVAYPGCPVPPCIHRAPATRPGRPPRLLLIS